MLSFILRFLRFGAASYTRHGPTRLLRFIIIWTQIRTFIWIWTKPAKKAQRLHGARSRLVYTRTVLQHREVHMRKVRSLQLSAGCRVEAEAGRAKWVL